MGAGKLAAPSTQPPRRPMDNPAASLVWLPIASVVVPILVIAVLGWLNTKRI